MRFRKGCYYCPRDATKGYGSCGSALLYRFGLYNMGDAASMPHMLIRARARVKVGPTGIVPVPSATYRNNNYYKKICPPLTAECFCLSRTNMLPPTRTECIIENAQWYRQCFSHIPVKICEVSQRVLLLPP